MIKHITLSCIALFLCSCTFKTYKYYGTPVVHEVRHHKHYHKHYVKKKKVLRHKHFVKGKSGFYVHTH